MEKDIYLLIANHLRDIHHLLESKITNSGSYSPKWTITTIGEKDEMVVELSSLYGIVLLLEKLANGQESQQFTMLTPEISEE